MIGRNGLKELNSSPLKDTPTPSGFLKLTLIGVYLLYNVVLISTVQKSDSVIHLYTLFFIFFLIMVYHKILNTIPCAIQ